MRKAARTAASSEPSGIAAIKCASTSVSVSEQNATPVASRRVRIAVTWLAMCRPARMRNPRRAFEATRQQFFELADAPLAFGEAQLPAVFDDGDAGGVVTAIFEPVQAFQ